MRKTEAEKLVNETFNQAYNEDRFRRFINELFHEYEKPEDKTYAGQYIWDAFKEGIVSYKRLCKFKDPEGMEVDVLAVKVPSRRTLENARTMQRNFIARYLNGSRGGKLKDAALVAFYSDDCDDWRFSLVRMDYVLDEEKQKVRKELTPARRFSFLVGKNEMTHTARRQLMPVLQSETETTLSELETAFNIETVTKEFFEKYKALYVSLKDALVQHLKEDKRTDAEFEGKSIKVEDFAKRLLGQIVFLYFLQKKGWLGVARGQPWGLGPKDFLQRLYRKELVAYDNFFNDVLEHLFYDALATERHTQDHFFPALNCKIPFLNGGLFEPFKGYAWDDTDILLDNAIFKEIFDVFDLYNFTVREDEPLDKEVAVDPEMLGKVFENLLEINERKSKGSFYTPREIVHYMCQESLINYLDAKLNIESRPVVEKGQQSLIPDMSKTDLLTNYEDIYAPVVPLEDIAEFIYHGDIAQEHDATAQVKNQNPNYKGEYQHKVPESVRKHAQVIDDALASVKICDPAIGSGAFPVGVMNEIVRARGALNAYLGDEGRTPYDFKRHAIQESIYGVDIEPSAVDIAKLRLWLSLVVDEDDFGNIKPLPNLEYKIRVGDSLLGIDNKGDMIRTQQLVDLEHLKDEYFSVTSPSRKAEIKNRVEAIIGELTSVHTKAQGLQQNARFDYRVYFSEVFRSNGGFDIVIANPPYGAKFSTSQKKSLLQLYKHQSNPPESYMLFVEQGHQLCHSNGIISYIIPNTWLASLTFRKFREFLASSFKWHSLLVVKTKAFEAVVDTNIFVFGKGSHTQKNDVPVFFFSPNGISLGHALSWNNISKNGDTINIVLPQLQQKLFHKIKAKSSPLKEAANVFNGVKPFEKGKGTPPQTAQIMQDKPFVVKGKQPEGDSWKPLLRGSLINRYKILWNNDSWINYGEWLAAPRDPMIFDAPEKIFVRQTGDSIIAAYGKSGFVARDNLHIILPKKNTNVFFLLGILNSKLMDFVYYFSNPEKGEALAQVKKNHVEELLLPKIIGSDLEKQVEHLVKQVLAAKLEDASAETSKLELKIDKLIYDAYGLTPEEIAIVEEAVK
jgi:hypothetical protein